ncbi:MAG: rane protein [Pedosphaera sp.]|nr:rane protein [Pedosphaera sp.]
MSAISSPSQSVPVARGNGAPQLSLLEIDASCRAPVLLLFVSAAVWLFLGSALGLIATLKFHSPDILANCAWFTYGRVHPAHLNAFVYGFAAQAAFGVLFYILSHLGRTRVAFVPGIIIGALLWNLGVTAGVLGILYGENTGFEWLEMPRYASVTLFFAYLFIGLGAMQTFHQRRERQLYISQWFLLAALFWFPWIYSTANILLVAKPVRGALQAAIAWWYAGNLMTVWFGFLGLAATFYFIPKLTKRPLHSHYLGIFTFWTLAIFGSWGGIPADSPLPAWMPAMSTFASVLTIVPILAVALNVRGTLSGAWSKMGENPSLKFIVFGSVAYVLASLAGALSSTAHISEITNFTWFNPAQTQMFLYGFFAMTMLGAIYYIVPRLMQAEFPSPKLVGLHFWLAMLGILLYVLALGIGGVKEGFALNKDNGAFLNVITSTLPFLRASTTGDLLMIIGHLLLLLNLGGLLLRLGRVSAKDAKAAWVDNTKTVEVVS